MKKFAGSGMFVLGVAVLALTLSLLAWAQNAAPPSGTKKAAVEANFGKEKEFRLERGMSTQAQACIECHKAESPGIFTDWAMSRHASANITCLDCHQAKDTDPDVSKRHFKQYERSDTKWGTAEYRATIAAVVTPKDCSRCHPDEVRQYSGSKHANTVEIMWKIDPWLNQGLNNETERTAAVSSATAPCSRSTTRVKCPPACGPTPGSAG
jgi:cytochrome c553